MFYTCDTCTTLAAGSISSIVQAVLLITNNIHYESIMFHIIIEYFLMIESFIMKRYEFPIVIKSW